MQGWITDRSNLEASEGLSTLEQLLAVTNATDLEGQLIAIFGDEEDETGGL